MKIHEYQAKAFFDAYNIPTQRGEVISNAGALEDAIDTVAKKYNAEAWVIKAQIHAGGRGKGGGVKFSPTRDKAIENGKAILGMNLVTPQTGPGGQLVRKVMVTEAIDIARELYVAITLDRSTGRDVIIASAAGGMDIEEVAKESPEKITKCALRPNASLLSYQIHEITESLGLTGALAKSCGQFLKALVKLYRDKDGSIVEVNPLVVTEDDRLIVLDAKINFDDNALFRHPDIIELRDPHEEDPSELEAQKYRLNFIKLDGQIGCMVNGAGLAMATMDIIKLFGGTPANFLDVGGTASAETVKNAFRIILSDKNVKAILINIFGGIVRCDRVAQGIVDAAKELDLTVPVVVRLAGTNAELAQKILNESDVKVVPVAHLHEAAEKVVSLSK